MAILQNLPFSLCESGPDQVDGIGNYFLEILAPYPSPVPLSILYLLDSHGQIPSVARHPDYDPIKKSQIDWFTATSKAHKKAFEIINNGDRVALSLAFFHIPLPEFGNPRLKIYAGCRGEPTEGPSENTNFFDFLAEEGISAVGCGHDHVNDFCALLPQPGHDASKKTSGIGPWLCYGGSCGFGGYCSYGGQRFHRRTRIWNLDTKDGSLRTWKRVEYADNRVDEVLLVNNGVIVDNLREESKNSIGRTNS